MRRGRRRGGGHGRQRSDCVRNGRLQAAPEAGAHIQPARTGSARKTPQLSQNPRWMFTHLVSFSSPQVVT